MLLEDGMYVKAVGVTFANKDGEHRQDILRQLSDLYGGAESILDIRLQRYTYQGSPAFHVVLDGKVIGNLPADLAVQVADHLSQGYRITAADPRIIGGTIDDWNDEDEEITRDVNFGLSFHLKIDAPRQQAYTYQPPKRQPPKPPAQMQYTYTPAASAPVQKPKAARKSRNVWKLILGILFLLWALQLFAFDALLFLAFGLIGGGLIFWWLLWDVWPKEKNPKQKDDYRRGPDL